MGLADSWEFGTNFNASEPGRSIGGRTLMGAIYRQLNQTVAPEGRLKFSLLAGSYDTFLAFFGLSDLTAADTDFFGLPDYASTMAFELFTAEDMTSFPEDASTLNVRFLFKNGTTAAAAPKTSACPTRPSPVMVAMEMVGCRMLKRVSLALWLLLELLPLLGRLLSCSCVGVGEAQPCLSTRSP